jgi:hypothetical protein
MRHPRLRGVGRVLPPSLGCGCVLRPAPPVAGQRSTPISSLAPRGYQPVPLSIAPLAASRLAGLRGAAPLSTAKDDATGFASEHDFHVAADATLEHVQDRVDALGDSVPDLEVALSVGGRLGPGIRPAH